MSSKTDFYDLVYQTVRAIPCGKVASYGQIAFMIGYPRRHRMVGQAMSHAPDGESIPWQRVVHSNGSLIPNYAYVQRELLAAEDVTFKPNGHVNMKEHQWHPEAGAGE